MSKLQVLKIARATFAILGLWFFIDLGWKSVFGYGLISTIVAATLLPIFGDQITYSVIGLTTSLFWAWLLFAYLADKEVKKLDPTDKDKFTSFTLWGKKR